MLYIAPVGLPGFERSIALTLSSILESISSLDGKWNPFSALVVIGDRKGRVGFGTGKAQEVPEAIRKAVEDAKKNLIEVPMVGTTIPHEVTSEFGGARVLLIPAVEGAGVAAGGAVRAVIELAGVADVSSKSLGSNTPINIVRATVEGLKQLKRAEEVAALRGISVSDLA